MALPLALAKYTSSSKTFIISNWQQASQLSKSAIHLQNLILTPLGV
jgi:hypothetical protein